MMVAGLGLAASFVIAFRGDADGGSVIEDAGGEVLPVPADRVGGLDEVSDGAVQPESRYLHVVANTRASSDPRHHQPLVGQQPVGALHRLGVDAQWARDVAGRRQSIAGSRAPVTTARRTDAAGCWYRGRSSFSSSCSSTQASLVVGGPPDEARPSISALTTAAASAASSRLTTIRVSSVRCTRAPVHRGRPRP